MKPLKFKLKNAFQFGWEGLKGWAYNSKEEFKNASVAYIEIDDNHGKIKNTLCDRVYFVIEGEGEFIINEEVIPVKKTDVVIIPKNTPYNYRGRMELLLVDTPAFEQEFDVKLE